VRGEVPLPLAPDVPTLDAEAEEAEDAIEHRLRELGSVVKTLEGETLGGGIEEELRDETEAVGEIGGDGGHLSGYAARRVTLPSVSHFRSSVELRHDAQLMRPSFPAPLSRTRQKLSVARGGDRYA
jgi:hypothetical protein